MLIKNIIQNPSKNGTTLKDHTITNITEIFSSQDVLLCTTIRIHDAPFVMVNTKVARYEPRHKTVRSYKTFSIEKYISNVSSLPLSYKCIWGCKRSIRHIQQSPFVCNK